MIEDRHMKHLHGTHVTQEAGKKAKMVKPGARKKRKSRAPQEFPTARLTGTCIALEPRILFDGAALATGAEVVQDTTTQDQPGVPDAKSETGTDSSTNTEASKSEAIWSSGLSLSTPSDRKEIVFIDTRVANYQTLMDGIDPAAEVILLDHTRDGIEQMSEVLSHRSDIDAIHVISHGNQGRMILGTGDLNVESMQRVYVDELAMINRALSRGADFLIYGCNFGEGIVGQDAANRLSELIGADVAASNDLTGAQSLGGDWDLEYTTGTIESGVITSSTTQRSWESLLATPIANDDPEHYNTYLSSLNPVGYWRLGESSGTTVVDEIGTNSGTYANSPTLSVSGATLDDTDTSVTFAGTPDNDTGDYAEIAHHGDYLIDEGTIQLWFNTSDVTQNAYLFSKDHNGFGNGGHVQIGINPSSHVTVRLQDTVTEYTLESTTALTADVWHHVAFTFGVAGMELYVDGVLEATDVYTGGLGTSSGGSGNTEPIVLGASSQTSTAGSATPTNLHYGGKIDEVAILNTQLAPEQVKNLYAAVQPDYSVSEEGTVNIPVGQGVLINDYDADGDPLTASNLDTTGALGLVTLNADGSFDYDPNGQFNTLAVGQTSTDTFTYTANDGGTNSAPATVTMTVTGENDAPVLTPASPTLTTITEDQTNNSGDLVSAIVGASITDVDTGAVEGIAITGLERQRDVGI